MNKQKKSPLHGAYIGIGIYCVCMCGCAVVDGHVSEHKTHQVAPFNQPMQPQNDLKSASVEGIKQPARAADDGLPPLPPRQHGENHNPKAAKWAELLRTMPDEKTSCAGMDVFYGQLAVDYKAKTKDHGAAKEAGVAAIERFAENFVHLRDLPSAFEEIPEMVAKAHAAGAKDPLLDLVEMLGHAQAGHSYKFPCFEATNLLGMRDAVKAQYKEGVAMVMAEGMLIYYASDAAKLYTSPASSAGLIAKVDPQNFIDAYITLGAAYAKGPGLQSGLLDCWLWTVHDNLGDYRNMWGVANKDSVPNMFLKINDQSVLDKQALFWGVVWEEKTFHLDLIQSLNAVQTIHADHKNSADAIDFLEKNQFKNDTTNCLRVEWGGRDKALLFSESAHMTLEAGFGPRFLRAVSRSKQIGSSGYQPRKGVVLARILDEAQASERNENAPLIAHLICQFFTIPAGPETPDLGEWLAMENVWPDVDIVFTRAWASLARRPEHWARVRARELFIRHLGMALAAKQPARVRQLLLEDAKRPTRLFDEAVAKEILAFQWLAFLDATAPHPR